MSRFQYMEPYLFERIEDARSRAKAIIQDAPKTEEELFDYYRVLLSSHYNIRFFDTIWDDYTLDKIAFEWFVIEERKKSADESTAESLSTEFKDDLSAMADEMEFGGSSSMPADESTRKSMNDFMETGRFPGQTTGEGE